MGKRKTNIRAKIQEHKIEKQENNTILTENIYEKQAKTEITASKKKQKTPSRQELLEFFE